MERLLTANMEADYPADPQTLCLQNGYDFDLSGPPNLIERGFFFKVGKYIIYPDQCQEGYCYVYTHDWHAVMGGEWESKEQALYACVEWARQNEGASNGT